MGLTGPTASLLRLAGKLATIDTAIPRMAREMGKEAAGMTRLSAAAQRTPEGAGWAAGAYTSSPMLSKSGAMLGSIRGTSTDASFSVRIGRRYAWYHQHGAVLRDSIDGSAGKLRTLTVGAGRGKSGPKRRLKQQGPLRKGRERGFLPARPILPQGGVPAAWRPALESIVESRLRAELRL